MQRALTWLRESLLTLAAIAGALSLVLVILTFAFGFSLVLFKSDSMSPTIPAGSAALTRQIPASAIQVGDVVTVAREGQLPVTHRVTAVEHLTGDQYQITMRGDANTADDVEPYIITEARIVVAHAPGLAYVIAPLGSPLVVGGLTLTVAALVTWAFWPQREPGPAATATPTHTPRRTPRHAAALLAALAAATLTLGHATPAAAAETVTEGTYLQVTSITDSNMGAIPPGGTTHWQVGIQTKPATPQGTVTVKVSGSANPLLPLTGSIQTCTVRWVGTTCAGTQETPQPAQPFPITADPLLTMPTGQQRWLLFTVTLAADGVTLGEHTTQLVSVKGFGETIEIVPEPPAPSTFDRTYGADRYATAVAVSQQLHPHGPVPVVYVATGTTFPDALAGAAGSYRAGGPLLLVRRDSIPAVVAAELVRLQPARIVVQGGGSAVGDDVVGKLGEYAPTVTRNAGRDRYETALLTARQFPAGGSVMLTTGANFPDGMAAGSLFHSFTGPVLLIRPGEGLSAAVAAELARLRPERVFVLGGHAAVAARVDVDARALGYQVVRLAGADRYGTAAAIAEWARVNAGFGRQALVATGRDFADGIVAGPLAGQLNAPLLLTNGTCWDAQSLAVLDRLDATLILIGGPAALAESVGGRGPC